MSSLLAVLVWLAAAAVAGWKLSQLVRAPDDRALRVVVAATALVAVALAAQLTLLAPGVAAALPPGAPKLVQNALLVVFFCAMLCVLASLRSERGFVRWSRWDVGLAVVVVAALVLLVLAAPGPVRSWTYEDRDRDTRVLAFYLVGNAYMAYACARGAVLAGGTARHTLSRARLGLRVAAAGLVVNLLFVHLVRTVSTTLRLAGLAGLPPSLERFSTPALALGIVLFSLGLGLPGMRTAWLKVRLWLRDRRRHARLRPLWAGLVEAFPGIALDPHPAWGDGIRPFALRRRFYRRIVECRDGLVLLSPYAEPSGAAETSPEHLAGLVTRALERRRAGREPTGGVRVLASPGGTSMEDDVAGLLALAEALRARA